MFATVFVSNWLFKTDFRIWSFVIRPFSAEKVWVAFKYLPLFLVYYPVNALAVNRNGFEGIPLSAATVQVLEYILENEEQGLPMTRLAERLGVTRGAFSKITAQLCSQGLVEKHHPEENGKEYILTLTEKGRRVYNAYSEAILEKVFAPIFAELDKQTPEQLEHTLQIFRLINKNSQT